MAREVVTGYCWPQSATAGRAGRFAPVVVRRAAGRASRWRGSARGGRSCSAPDAVAADEHETPKDASSKGCGWPVALTLDVDPTWRSGYYEVVMEIDVGEKVRRDFAFFVVRPSPGTRIVLALATNTWHAYNDFGGPNLYTGGTHVAMQRPMAAGYLYKPPGKGRRVTGTGAPDPQNAAHVGYIQLNHLSGYAGSAGWPDWELPFIEWAEREGLRDRRVHERRSRSASRGAGRRAPVPVGRPRRVLVTRDARHGRRRSSPAAATPRSSRATRRCGRCASRATTTT